MKRETSAELLAQAKRDYGTAAERAQRAADAKAQRGAAQIRAHEAALAPRGQRR